jgi:hypothetical protein
MARLVIAPSPFLDPRGQPRNARMDFIGGPLDGETWSIYVPFCNEDVQEKHGGRYVYASTREWAFIWMPDR